MTKSTETSERLKWRTLHSRLEQTRLNSAQASDVTEVRRKRILKQRAAELAGRTETRSETVNHLKVLTFSMASGQYALPLDDIVEVRPQRKITPVPGGPPALLGVAMLRTEIGSVIDLAQLLDQPAAEPVETSAAEWENSDATGIILIVRSANGDVGFRVDAVDSIVTIQPEDLQSVTAEVPSLQFLRGILPQRFAVLDTEALFGHSLFQLDDSA